MRRGVRCQTKGNDSVHIQVVRCHTPGIRGGLLPLLEPARQGNPISELKLSFCFAGSACERQFTSFAVVGNGLKAPDHEQPQSGKLTGRRLGG
jgi:hypothetical protein